MSSSPLPAAGSRPKPAANGAPGSPANSGGGGANGLGALIAGERREEVGVLCR